MDADSLFQTCGLQTMGLE